MNYYLSCLFLPSSCLFLPLPAPKLPQAALRPFKTPGALPSQPQSSQPPQPQHRHRHTPDTPSNSSARIPSFPPDIPSWSPFPVGWSWWAPWLYSCCSCSIKRWQSGRWVTGAGTWFAGDASFVLGSALGTLTLFTLTSFGTLLVIPIVAFCFSRLIYPWSWRSACLEVYGR